MNYMITCIRLQQAAIISDVRNGTLSLLAGSSAEICSIIIHLFLRVNVHAWNFNIRQDILVPEAMIPAQVIETLSICKIILYGIFKHIPNRRRQIPNLHSRIRMLVMIFLSIISNTRIAFFIYSCPQ